MLIYFEKCGSQSEEHVQDLLSAIKRFRYSEDDVVGYLVQILQGIEYLHNRRVLHLDLKPDNIMVTNLNTVKIVDFGSAQSFNPLSLRHQDSAAGALEYMGEDTDTQLLPNEKSKLCNLFVYGKSVFFLISFKQMPSKLLRW